MNRDDLTAVLDAVVADDPRLRRDALPLDGRLLHGDILVPGDPLRTARVEVPTTDLINMVGCGHEVTTVDVDPEDLPEELADLVHLAARLVLGPTRLLQEWDGHRVVRSRFDPEVMAGLDHADVDWPLRRWRARLGRRRLEQRVVELPRLGH